MWILSSEMSLSDIGVDPDPLRTGTSEWAGFPIRVPARDLEFLFFLCIFTMSTLYRWQGKLVNRYQQREFVFANKNYLYISKIVLNK
jgi:hypothetical protein